MSFLKNLFGPAPKKPTLNTNQGLEQLEEKAEMLRKRLAHLQDQALEQEKIAKQNVNTNKPRALMALKKKKAHEENINKVGAMLENIENQKDMLENASANAAVLKTMAETAKIVKQEHENLDINKVEDIVDQIREQQEISDEVANILSQNTNKPYDEDDLLKELEQMSSEDIDQKLLKTGKDAVTLPDVPTQLPAESIASTSSQQPKKKDEDELDELKKWASTAQ